MEKIKDFFYAISDLILTAVILIAMTAAFFSLLSPYFSKNLDFKSIILSMENDKSDQDSQTPVKPAKNEIMPEDDKLSSGQKSEEMDNNETSENLETGEKPETTASENVQGQEQNNQAGKSNAQNTSAGETSQSQTPAKTVKLTVPDGASSEKVAEILYDNGFIKSKEDYTEYLIKSKNDTKLRAGTFELKTGSSYEELTKTLMGK